MREAANETQRHALLKRIAAGTRIACALSGPDGRPPPDAVAVQLDNRAGTRVLNGVSDFVIHADSAELLLVLARSGGSAGLSVVVLPAATPGISITPHVMLDLTRPMAQVAFNNVPVAEQVLLARPMRPMPGWPGGLTWRASRWQPRRSAAPSRCSR